MSEPSLDEQLNDPDSPLVKHALARKCQCKAAAGELCRNTAQPGKPLPGRLVHYVRLM